MHLLHKDHAAAADRRRRSHLQVLHLEHHVHRGRHLDALRVGEAEHAIVVQHGVHVLDPHRVHGAVEQDPRAIVRASFGLGHRLPEKLGHDTVRPLACHQVEAAKQLARGDRLGVQDETVHHFVETVAVLNAVPFQLR